MAKNEISDYDETDSGNTDISGITLSDATLIDQLDNIARAQMGALARFTGGDTIASASTTNLASVPGQYVTITGVVAIGAFGTIKAGTIKYLKFDGALVLTHNATTLILPGGANIVTTAGDVAVFVSEGSGNWRCVSYQRASGSAVVTGAWESISTTTLSSAADWRASGLSAYRTLRITGYLNPATDAVSLSVRTSINNGSSFEAGASDYSWYRLYGTGTTAAADGNTGDTRIQISLTGSVGNDADEGVHFEMKVYNFNQSLMARFITTSQSITAAGSPVIGTTGGLRLGTTARNAIAIFFSSGNIASGFVALEGIRG